MRLEEIQAIPHPGGHRIDLKCANPDPTTFPGVRVVRREGTHPVAPDDGFVVAHGEDLAVDVDELGRALYSISDTNLRGDTIYYYSLFPYHSDPPEYHFDDANRASSLAGGLHNSAGQMLEMLPAIYHRYDAEADQLRRFMDLPGGQLDLLWSFARALLDSYDVNRVGGALLPLLAEWIGWKLDFSLEVDSQRNEIRNAPAIYQRTGLIPVIRATVKRVSGWESRCKEFVHNVARSNQPERLNIWVRFIGAAIAIDPPDKLLSLNFAYEGRPTATEDDHGIRWLFYHTMRRDGWQIWFKTSPTFTLGLDVQTHLDAPDMASLQKAFADAGFELAADAAVTRSGNLWRIDDSTNGQTYVVEPGQEALTVYHTSVDAVSYAPSLPFATAGAAHEKCPAVALQVNTLWLFWSACDHETGRWEIRYRTRRDGIWSETQAFTHGASGPTPERRSPAVLVDQDDGLWLFWQERIGGRWQLKYNRYDSAGLSSDPLDPSAWDLAQPVSFPLDDSRSPRVEDDLFALSHQGDPNICLFWARKEPAADPRHTRWTLCYRFKSGNTPGDDSDWSEVGTLLKDDEDAHDREPAARVNDDGDLDVFWSSNRGGSWSIWRVTLPLDVVPPTPPRPADMEELTSAPYSQRTPFSLGIKGGTLLFYRSNESLSYSSEAFGGSPTVDFRYAGATTVHTRNVAKIGLRGEFDDSQTYTLDTGQGGERGNHDWYHRDTIGVYLDPDTSDPEALLRGLARLEGVVPEFMPATDRAVFVRPPPTVHTESIYTYGRPDAVSPRFIAEHFHDVLSPDSDRA